jgi:hypothetical protein
MAKGKRKTQEPAGEPVKLTTSDAVVALLRQRYAAPAWAFFENVADGTGGAANRYADGLAMSLWPSRGLTIEGFEVKVSRQDVVRELETPQKADAVGRYCDAWWLVVGSASLVAIDELPGAWGLLVPTKIRGVISLRAAKAAAPLEPRAIDRKFLAALLRRTAERFDPVRVRQDIRAEIYKEVSEQVHKDVDGQHEYRVAELERMLEHAHTKASESVAALRKVSKLGYDADVIERACALLRWFGAWNGGPKQIEQADRTLRNEIANLTQTADALASVRELLDLLQSSAKTGDT